MHNEAKNHKLKIEFRMPEIEYHESDTAFDLVRREVRKPSAGAARPNEELEICQDPSNSQIYAGDIQIVHIGMQEYEVEKRGEGDVCSLTALRCTGDLSRRDLRTRGGGAGPGYETPGGQCIGDWEFDYGLIYGRELFSPEHVIELKTSPIIKQSYVWSPDERRLWLTGNILYSSYQYSDGGWVLRMFHQKDWEEVINVRLGRTGKVWLSDLGGLKKEFLGEGDSFSIRVPGCKIITMRVEEL